MSSSYKTIEFLLNYYDARARKSQVVPVIYTGNPVRYWRCGLFGDNPGTTYRGGRAKRLTMILSCVLQRESETDDCDRRGSIEETKA